MNNSHPTLLIDPKDVSETPENLLKQRTMPAKEVHFMQNSISNPTGDFFVLQNVLQLVDSQLRKQLLGPIRTWVSKSDGKIWTLDHRRLAAYKAAGIDDVPIKWANQGEVLGDAGKMTTELAQGGRSMKINVSLDETGKFVKGNAPGARKIEFVLEETAEGLIVVKDNLGKVLTPDDIRQFLP